MTKTGITILLMLCVSLSNAQINSEKIDSIVNRAAANDFFEGSVLVADGGNVVYQKFVGVTDTDTGHPVTGSTVFGIASITKMVTAIIILQLVEEGKFQLDDPIKSLLPEVNIENADKITVHHLLLHISGLPNEDDLIYNQPRSPLEFINETKKNNTHPFGSFHYTNIDYVLLGLIIEKYDRKSWKISVQNRILDRLAMDNTGFLEKGKYPGDFAYSFSYDQDNKKIKDPLFHIENFYAAGCMYSNAVDLLKLDQAMYGNKLLSEESIALMFTSYPEYNYTGYGVWTYNYPFVAAMPMIMERRGSISGANCVLIRMIELNRTIIILSNNNKFNPDSFGDTASLREALMIETSR